MCKNKHPQKVKTRINCEIFETKYTDISFQGANICSYILVESKNIILLKSYPQIFTSIETPK